MALHAKPATCFVLVIVLDAFPVSRVRIAPTYLRTVTLNADIAVRVTGLA